MERRYLLIGIFSLIFSMLFGTFLFGIYKEKTTIPEMRLLSIKEAEDNLGTTKNLAGFYSKYSEINIEYYYDYKYCKEAFDTVMDELKGLLDKSKK